MRQKSNSIVGTVFWSCVQTFSSQLASLVVTTILARIVIPEAYGIIAAASVFVSFATSFSAGGFSNALIQKKDADEKDFSSMFYFTVTFSVGVYILVYFLAPTLVHIFNQSYDQALLIKVIRVQGISVCLSSINAFFRAIQEKRLWFRNLSIISIWGTLISGCVGVFLAYMGAGVWALVVQNILAYVINGILLFLTTKWVPKLCFSFARLKPMLQYGLKMMLAGLTIALYADITSLVIGNRYSVESLAFYNKGIIYPKTLALNMVTAVSAALFPIMSKMQDNYEIKVIVRKFSCISAFLITPMMLGLAAVAPSLVEVLLGERWLPAVSFFRISCINYAIQPIAMANLQYLKAAGRAGEYLGLDLFRKGIGILLLMCSIAWGTDAEMIAVSEVVSNFISIFINIFPGKKYISYSFREQFFDVMPKFLISGIMFIVVSWIGTISAPAVVLLTAQMIAGVAIYLLLASILRMKELNDLTKMARRILSRGKDD